MYVCSTEARPEYKPKSQLHNAYVGMLTQEKKRKKIK